jgi:hypothetical protein
LNNLELRHLKRLCDKYGIDYQEIDDTLTYYENRTHIRSIIKMLSQSLDVFELERMAELQEQYMKEHFIDYYITCQIAGETKSDETGEVPEIPETQPFSLKDFVEKKR